VLCDCIGRPEWRDRSDYKDFKVRLQNRARLTEELDGVLSARTTSEWIELFAGRVPAAPVHDVRAALENLFVRNEGRVRVAAHPLGQIQLLAPPIRCAGDAMPCQAAPPLGADTDQILSGLGFAQAEIARLRGTGVL
jgi:crotonobetainyl-CoA:carnitine CoA-transferase CaiB-like acyl-CoA transferase